MFDTSDALILNDVSVDEIFGMPLKNTARSMRRHDLARIKKNRAKHLVVHERGAPAPSARRIGIHANTATPVSGSLSGNPRRHWGQRTIQELKTMQRIPRGRTNGV